MSSKLLQNTGLFLLALVFSVGLMFAFIELPQLADRLLQSLIDTPQTDPAYDGFRIEIFYHAYAIRLIGYLCLALIAVFIVLGFTTRKTGWAWMSSIALFLPVFATFANSMFYLAGLGLFNVVLFPLQDASFSFLDLGKVVLVPYWILHWFFGLFHWNAHQFIVYLFMVSGAFIFISGVFSWFLARNDKQNVARLRIYKFSRHPQYLGWILWSYGLMLFGPSLNQMKKSWGWYGTLAWLLSTLIIIGICMLEEIKMQEKAGSEYEAYRNQTPFLFPIPGFLKKILKAPMRWVIRKERPVKRKEVGWALTTYAFILMALSLFWIDFGRSEQEGLPALRPYSRGQADSLVTVIEKPQIRRYRPIRPFYILTSMGKQAQPQLFKLMHSRDADVREFALQAASAYRIREAIPFFIHALNDSSLKVAHAAVEGLGNLQAIETEDTLIALFHDPRNRLSTIKLIQALSKMKSYKAMPLLVNRLHHHSWVHRMIALNAMAELDINRAKPYLYKALEDSHERVRQESVTLILKYLPEDAVPHLEKVLHDKNWDVRFYARQAIRMIEKKEKSR